MHGRAPQALILGCLLAFSVGCARRLAPDPALADTGTSVGQVGPRIISRPPPGVAEYMVDVKPEFDHVKYAGIIASRTRGKVGYIYHNFHASTIYGIADSTAETIRRMQEVLSVRKAGLGHLD